MHKAILMMILAWGSNNAAAAWVYIGELEGLRTYYNPESIRKAGKIVKMEHLFDLSKEKEVAGKLFRSISVEAEYDCKEGQSRAHSSFAYSGQMGMNYVEIRIETSAGIGAGRGTGSAIKDRRSAIVNSVTEPGKWKPVVLGSTVDVLSRIACGKE